MTSTNSDPNRISRLLNLAHEEQDAATSELTTSERDELAELRQLLDAIDDAWQATPPEQDRVRSLFLQQLAEENPMHPWVRENTVRTLGDLLHRSDEELPELAATSYEQLASDPTPVETLLDPTRRTAAIGQAIHRAQVPQAITGEFLLWLNATLAALVPRIGPSGQGLLFTRQQRKSGKGGPRRGR